MVVSKKLKVELTAKEQEILGKAQHICSTIADKVDEEGYLTSEYEEMFDEIGSTNDAAQTWQTYTQQTESLVEEQQALIDTYQRLADEGSQFLTQKYGQYFSIGNNGKLLPDISFIEDALARAKESFIKKHKRRSKL